MATRQVIRHFADAASGYTQLRDTWPLGALRRQEQRALHALVRVEPGARALDAGCGDGETLAWLAASGARGVGVDIAWPMAVRCRRRGFPVCVQDIERLGFRPRFDWVLCIGSMEFTEEPGRAMKALAGCLRPDGRLALLFPRRNWLGALYALYHRTHGVHIRLFSCHEVTALLTDTGLEQETRRHCALSTVCVARVAGRVRPQGAGGV